MLLALEQLPFFVFLISEFELNMIPSPILQALQQKPAFDIYSNPYRAKRSWPPDFTKLTPKHQFRLERRYKRRVKLKWARPRWTKAVKLMQLGSIVGKAAWDLAQWERAGG
jgi:hypothetical protein